MQINIRADSVEIEGYVNAIERLSRPMKSRLGRFVERIKKGAFKRAIERNDNIRLLLNHDWGRDLGGTKEGTLELREDNIGLHAKATITDKEVIEKARNGDLVGWSFGFDTDDNDADLHDENGMATRDVKDLKLFEVSLLDRRKTPAYEGTLVNVRSDEDDKTYFIGEAMFPDVAVRELDQPKQHEDVEPNIDYSEYEQMIADMREDN